MKRQFMQRNSSRGANPSSQPALPAEQAESGENFHQQEAPMPGRTSPATTKKGLLSSWSPANQAVQQNRAYNQQSMPPVNGNMPNNFNGNQVSPHSSSAGMTPFATFQGPQNGQQQQPSFNGQRPQNGQPMKQQGPMGGPQQQRPRQTSPLNPAMANMQQPMGMSGQQSMHGNMQQQPLNRVAGPPSQPFGNPNQQSMHGNMQQPMGNPISQHNNSGPYNNGGNFNNAIGVMTQPRQTGPLNNRNTPGSFGKPPFKSGKSQSSQPKRRFPLWARIALGVFVVLLIISGGGFWYYQQNYADFVNKATGQTATKHHIVDNGQTNSALTASSDTLTGGRINILLLGSDNDGKNGNNLTPLAQTDIIITIDPQTHYVGMLSIPRDLQVTQSDNAAHWKLDEVFSHGGYANDLTTTVRNSAGLSIQTIEYNFGIHINYYAWVGLSGFVKVIDTAGGVDIDAIHPMVDDNYPFDVGNKKGNNTDYERLYIPPGPQHMNGIQALTYVRTRHSDLVGDFGRSVRQQQILSQLKTKLATPGIVGELPQLINDLKGDVITDMPPSKMVELANYARGLDPNKIDRVTLSPPNYSYASSQKNSSNFYPNCYAIRQKITQMFNLGNTANCIPQDGYREGSIGYTPSPSSAGSTIADTTHNANTTYTSANSSISMLAQTNELDLSQSSQTATIHSILDLLFAVTFESPEGLQV